MINEKRLKIRLNSVERVEALLQEIYDDACRQVILIQNKINELEQSTKLSDEFITIDLKAKYAKAIHDYITDKEKAIGRKLDVSRLMTEVLKKDGNVEAVVNDKQILENLDSSFRDIQKMFSSEADNNNDDTDKPELYITKK